MAKNKLQELIPPEWEQQPSEPDRWFMNFETYYRKAYPDITLSGAWKRASGKKSQAPGTWREAFEAYRWRERCEAWLRAERAKRAAEEEQQRIEARDRHIQLAKGLAGLAARGMQYLARTEENIAARDVATLAKTSVDIERLALGTPTEIIQLLAMPEDQLIDQLRKLEAASIDSQDSR